LVTRLTLSGIVAGDPAQAIIEDTETKKTYFVTAGQPVAEGAVLDQVESNRVILDLNGEKITLSL
jgi:type II secretory pathway component PulC